MADSATIKADLRAAFRDHEVDGVPASGPHEPDKAAIRAALALLVDLASAAGTTKVVATVADLATLPDPGDGDRAEVRADPAGDVENGNGVYSWSGAAWTWISPLIPGIVQTAIEGIEAAAAQSILDVEAAGVNALAALPASRVVPTTVTLQNPNLFSMASVAPHVGDATSAYLGLAGGSNTSTLVEVTLPNGIGKKTLIMPDGGGIPLRHLTANYPMMIRYVAALDRAVLLFPEQPAASIITTEVAAGDTAAHIRRKIAPVGGRWHPHADVNQHQTIDIIVTNDKIFGNCSFTLYDRDGTTQLFTGVIRDTDKVTVLSAAGAWKVGSLLRLRSSGGAPYVVQPTDRVTQNLSKLQAAIGMAPPQLPNIDNPVQVYRADEITWFIDVYPHDAHYTGAQKRNRGSDYTRFIMINMGPFMAISVAPALNGYLQQQKRQLHPWSNFMFDDVPTGTFPETGLSPSTVEPIFYSKKVGGPPAVQAGLGHNYLIPDSWKMTGTKSDPSTGALAPNQGGITAATTTNPLTVTIPGHGYVVGRTFTPEGVVGMTQINGVPLTVTAINGDVLTIGGVDATGFGAFVSHPAPFYVEKDAQNLQNLPIGKVYSGDRVVSVFTGWTATATPGEQSSKFTYTLTFESKAAHQCRGQVRYDPTAAGVNVQLATVNGNMAYLLPVRDADFAAGFLGGAPVNALHSGTHLLPINQGDNAQRAIGMVDEVRLFWSGAPTAQIRVRNLSGAPDGGSPTGYSHKENGVRIPRAGNTFVTAFDHGNKVYGDPIRTAAGEQDVHLIVFDFEFDITMLSADPIV